MPVAHSATSPDFYMNNFHGLIFTRLRVTMGEDAESAKVSVFFFPYWVQLREATDLHSEKSLSSRILAHAEPGDRLLIVAPGQKDWSRVYDPKTHRKGYISSAGWEESKCPPLAENDAETRELEKPVMEHQTVRKANAIVRIVTWLGFAAFGLFAAWRTRGFTEFLVWSAASLLGSYFFIITEIWPWYVNWALALGALAPERLPARLAMVLSAGVLTLYVTLGLEGSRFAWLFQNRSLLAFVLPLLIFTMLWLFRWRKQTSRMRAS